MRKKENLAKLLNVNYLFITNQTICSGKYDLPEVYCSLKEDDIPDYIALYSQPCQYHFTEKTVVSFYDYDVRFNGEKGLYNAIYYNNEKRLNEFKKRFKGVKYFISPDYSMIGDGQFYHNLYNYGISREVALWLSLELNASVIPNIPCSSSSDLDFITGGLREVNTVAFSTKGRLDLDEDLKLINLSLQKVLNDLPKLKTILVYDVAANSEHVYKLFEPAIKKGLKVIIPNNSLKTRNSLRGEKNVQH